MIRGIPYFGEDNQVIYDKILSSDTPITNNLRNQDLYEFINNYIEDEVVVIINNKWLTWLKDIKFNYRDKKCYIPYFEYETHNISELGYRGTNKGHLLLQDDTLCVRHNYLYKELDINIDGTEYLMYNLSTREKFTVSFDSWIVENEFDIEQLYQLYLDSCYVNDDFLIQKHNGGYHLIDKEVKGFRNKERLIRRDLGLYDFNFDARIPKDYRDVRNFKYEQVVQLVGFRETIELYHLRRIRFESYLYCILRSQIKSNNAKFNNMFEQLGKTKSVVKYGDNIKLIFKDYWLDEYKTAKQRTYSRV